MSFNVQYPALQLTPYIKQYWSLEGSVEQDIEHLQRIVPSGFAELIFYFDSIPAILNRPGAEQARSVINGQQSDYYELRVTGKIDLFSVMFTPHGTRQFFDLPVNELYNQNIPLQMLNGAMAERLEQMLYHAHGFNKRIAIIEEFLLQRLHNNRLFEFNRIADSIGYITRLRGKVRIDTLASRACLSRKQYERIFSGFIGIGPKQFLRVIRFQNAISLKQQNPSLSLTAVAYESGYADQSHMIKEFSTISGLTPGQYFSECDPVSDYFS